MFAKLANKHISQLVLSAFFINSIKKAVKEKSFTAFGF